MQSRYPLCRCIGASPVMVDESGYRAWFERLVLANYRLMFATAYRVLRNSADAEDASQVAVIKAFERLGALRSHGAATPWLLTITRNVALDMIKRGGEARRLTTESDSALERTEDKPELECVSWDSQELLFQEIEQLPDRYQEAILLRHLEGLDIPALAERLGISPVNARIRLFRAYKILRSSRPLRVGLGMDE